VRGAKEAIGSVISATSTTIEAALEREGHMPRRDSRNRRSPGPAAGPIYWRVTETKVKALVRTQASKLLV
jgi:hypothetical protein